MQKKISDMARRLPLLAALFALALCPQFPLTAFDLTGRPVVIFDGSAKRTVYPLSEKPEEILAETGYRLGQHDAFWTVSGSRGVSSILIERAVPVTIVADGRAREIYTTGHTVQGVLNEAGFDWKKRMPAEDGLTRVTPGMTIHVERYTHRASSRRETVKAPSEKWYDARLARDVTQTVRAPVDGERVVETVDFLSDGKVLRSEVVREEIVKAAVPGMVRTGNPEGTVGRVLSMRATAYHPTDGDGRGITATGTQAARGTVAVDPTVIPLGSTVYVPGYGDAVAADTGSAILGHRIDLCMETFPECWDYGVQDVDVYVKTMHNA